MESILVIEYKPKVSLDTVRERQDMCVHVCVGVCVCVNLNTYLSLSPSTIVFFFSMLCCL